MRVLYFYHEIEDQYEAMLDEHFGTVSIADYNFPQGYALRILDETTFSSGVKEWCCEKYLTITADELTAKERDYYGVTNEITYYNGLRCNRH